MFLWYRICKATPLLPLHFFCPCCGTGGKKFAKLKWNSGSLSQTKEANFGGIQGQRDGREEGGGRKEEREFGRRRRR